MSAAYVATSGSDWHCYDDTERIKVVRFQSVGTVGEAIEDLRHAWSIAVMRYTHPLVQVRVILRLTDQEHLLASVAGLAVQGASAWVAGRIPFRVYGQEFAIYAVHLQASGRPSYATPDGIDHATAVSRGYDRRGEHLGLREPDGFTLHAVEFVDGVARYLDGDSAPLLQLDALARELAHLHRLAFEYAHDPAQQSVDGVWAILQANPVLFATAADGTIVAVLYPERDARFSFGGIALIEPTGFTHPAPIYRRHGLFARLSQTLVGLVQTGTPMTSYGGAPVIMFGEAVRHTAFPAALASGAHLAGTRDLRIAGDLGNAYTAIGPARPDRGFMPMGMLYATDPRITACPGDGFSMLRTAPGGTFGIARSLDASAA